MNFQSNFIALLHFHIVRNGLKSAYYIENCMDTYVHIIYMHGIRGVFKK